MHGTFVLLGGLLAFLALPPTAAEAWTWPVRGRVVGRFAYARANPFAAGQRRGIDIAAPRGTPVVAACGGWVRFAGPIGTSGRTVSTACGAYVVSYLHLDAIAVRRGARVHVGEPIGAVGTTGRRHEARPHLSFGVRRARDRWGYVDPLRLLPREGASPPDIAPLRRRGAPPRAGPIGRAPYPDHRPLAARVRRSAPIGGAAEVDSDSPWVAGGAALMVIAAAAPLATLRIRRARRRPTPRAEAAARPAGA
jgi:Peptidase family M23